MEYLSKSTSVTLCLTAGTLLSIRSSTSLPMLTMKEFSPVTGTARYWFLYSICKRYFSVNGFFQFLCDCEFLWLVELVWTMNYRKVLTSDKSIF